MRKIICPININTKAKKYFWGINFTLISVSTVNINILGGTVSGTNRNHPWDKLGPSPGQIGTRPWDKPVFSSIIPQYDRHFFPFVPGTGGGSSLGRLSHKGRQKNAYVFSFYCFFLFFALPSKTRQQIYAPATSRVKLAKFSAKLVANFRRSLEGDFRASFAGENRQKHFHQNSTANFTIKLHYEVLGCGGPYKSGKIPVMRREKLPTKNKTH